MFGWDDQFTYIECAWCGSLRIKEIPDDLGRYYPDDYFSLRPVNLNWFVTAVKRSRSHHTLGRKNILGAVATRAFGPPEYASWAHTAQVEAGARILDVGAGTGERVFHMTNAGFARVVGLDPHIDADLKFQNGAAVHKASLAEFDGTWDLVMSHHSFEHMPDPLQALGHMRRLLASKGVALLRVPVAGTYAWNTYKTKWVQLDAPRHLTLHTRESITALAGRVGFEVENVAYDSTAFQFWGSELYQRDVPLVARSAYAKQHNIAPANKSEMRMYKERAAQLNRSQQGDQAAFYLRKI